MAALSGIDISLRGYNQNMRLARVAFLLSASRGKLLKDVDDTRRMLICYWSTL